MASFTFADREFTDITPIETWVPPRRAGLYAIVAVPMPLFLSLIREPIPGRLIYVGQSENMDERGVADHHKRACWFGSVLAGEALVVATHFIPITGSTGQSLIYRGLIEHAIIARYDPPCNDAP